MTASGAPRPDLRDVLPVEIAETELSAVRALLEDLRADVSAQEAAAAQAERVVLGSTIDPDEASALEESTQLVQQLAAVRRAELRALADLARREAEEQVRAAARMAAELSAASRRDAAELLRDRVATGTAAADAAAPLAPPPGPPPAEPSDAPGHWGEPLPGLQHWAEPPTEAVAAVVPAAPVRPTVEARKAHEQFWREEEQATAARTAGIAPIEALLPTAALVILLIAVLLLIG
jgi:hypothetical protein